MAFCGKCFNEHPGGKCPYCGYDPAADIAKYAVALPSGSILSGRYIVGRVLGQGGFGITYAALDYDSKKLVAIKEHFPAAIVTRAEMNTVRLMSSDMADSFLSGKEKFLAEARTLSQFNGLEQICDIYSYFEENGTAYFAMEYVEGIPLDQYIKKLGRMLSFEEALRLLLPVMKALSVVHAAGIIHRDLAPDNIIVKPYGGIMLIDFGAARYSMGEMSRSLDVILKHGFAPKEQYARRGRQGAYTDVYAIAATFYYAITGRVPPDAIERSDDDELVAPSKLGVSIPHRAEAVLLKALAVDYKSRFQSMDELIQKLSPFLPDLKKELEARQNAERKAQSEKLAAERRAEAERREAERKAEAERRATERKALEEKREAERKAEEERRAAERKAAEEKREAERKAAEEKREAERKAAEEKRQAERLAQEAKRQAELRAQEEARKAREEQKALEAARKAEAKAAKKAKADAAEKPKKKSPVALIAALAAVAIGAGAFFALSADKAQAPVIQKEEAAIETAAPAEATPAPTEEPAHIEWTLSNDGTLIISGEGAMEDYLPDAPAPWSSDAENIKALVVEEGITAIGVNAFLNCKVLETAEIAESVSSIGSAAFSGCEKLSSVNIPAKITKINSNTFFGCLSLRSISIPNSVKSVAMHAFANTALQSVEFSGTEEQWAKVSVAQANIPLEEASVYCAAIAAGEAGENLSWMLDKDGTLAISGTGPMDSYILVDKAYHSTTAPWGSDECRSNVRKVVLSPGITSVGNYAFKFCDNLYEVSLPDGITRVGPSAFDGCDALRVVNFDGTEEQWSGVIIDAFNDPLNNAQLNCTAIANGTAGENISWLISNDGTLSISGEGAIGDYTADAPAPWSEYAEDIKALVVEEGITAIGVNAFLDCKALESTKIADSVSHIGGGAFTNCEKLTSFVIPPKVTEINTFTFFNCLSLRSITIPYSVKIIYNAFANTSLQSVEYIGTQEQWANVGIVLGNTLLENAYVNCTAIAGGEIGESITWIIDKNGTLIISGKGAMPSYGGLGSGSEPPWLTPNGSYIRKAVISPGITTLNGLLWLSNLSEVEIPASVKIFGTGAFYNSGSLRDIYYGGTEEQWNEISINMNNEQLNSANIHFAQ